MINQRVKSFKEEIRSLVFYDSRSTRFTINNYFLEKLDRLFK